MPKYRVNYRTQLDMYVTVEAEDEEAAEQEAYNVMPHQICAQCTGWGSKGWSRDIGEWEMIDDNPEYGIKAVELVED